MADYGNLDIYEIYNKKTFVKASGRSLKIGKIILSFVMMDEKTKKAQDNIDIYLDIADAKLLCTNILNGAIAKELVEKKKNNDKGGITLKMGGINEEKCKERKIRDDGKALSRTLKIEYGNKIPFVLSAEERPGTSKIDENGKSGIIIPDKVKAEKYIMVACEADDLKKLALMINTYIDAWTDYKVNEYFSRNPKSSETDE